MKKLIALLLALVMIVSMVACGAKEEPAPEAAPEAAPEVAPEAAPEAVPEVNTFDPYTPYPETVTFTYGAIAQAAEMMQFPEGDDYNNNPYTRYVLDTVNVQSQTEWEVDANNFNQKVALSISSGDMPDMLIVDRTMFKQLADNDMLADLSEIYDACASDYVKSIYDSYGDRIFKDVTVDGKLLGIPGTAISGQEMIMWIRTDWLEKVKMDVPSTLAELEAVLKAFVEQDVGGNGTIGMTASENIFEGYNGTHGLNNIASIFGAYPDYWIEQGGEVVYGSTTPEMKTALAKLAEWYQEGILDKEFALRKGSDRDELVASGRVGCLFAPWWAYAGIPESVQNDPNGDWIAVAAPVDANGKMKTVSQDPINGVMVISKDCENPEAVIKALNCNYDLLRNNSNATAAHEQMLVDAPGLNWGAMSTALSLDYSDAILRNYKDINAALEANDTSVMVYPSNIANYEAVARNMANPKSDINDWNTNRLYMIAVPAALSDTVEWVDAAFYGQTESMANLNAILKTTATEAFVKIIMGEEPIDYFDTFVEQWNAQGGAILTEEVRAACN